ncbi:MAG: iron chelate uptake ABC transporter family permease subunit [Acidobacteria bacterium]|nr:iron chelate uptake ABC transporter family permease subunit [Acidobacteriota bacterium]
MNALATARQRRARVLAAAGALLGVGFVLGPTIGATDLDLAAVWAAPFAWDENPAAAIFFMARLPRVLLAAIVGASLALAGATYQSLLRNPLASPYTLGITAGASLMTFLVIRFVPAGGLAEFTVPAAALVGALLTTLLVMALATRRGGTPPAVLLLAGVTLNFTIGAAVLLVQYFADYTATARMVRWMMGDLEGATYRLLAIQLVASAPAWMVLLRRGRMFNLMSLGLDEAQAHGVDAARETRTGLLWASWLTGVAVAVAGPVGFVGILVPHAVRLLGGVDYRVVLPGALVGGAGFLVLCDLLSRWLLRPVELPVGILTACLGGPFFLILLLRREVGRG